jgi:crotonobetaine/carnitine-CoA ligase
MHPYARYFSVRSPADDLDTAPLLHAGLLGGGDRAFLWFEGAPITCAGMAAQVAAMQRMLAGRGLRRGDRVALVLENSVEHVALIYALLLSGMVWVPVNTRLKGPGVSYVLSHAQPALVVAQRAFEEVLAAAAPAAPVAWLEELRPPAADAGDLRLADIGHADPLCVMYTSGTTGAPKGVVFTHRMMRIAGEAALVVTDARDGDRLFLWEPLCHIGGAQMLLLPFLRQVELHAVTRFSASRVWEQLVRARATQLHYLGGILDILMQQPAEAVPKRHEVRVAWGAGVSARSWDAIQQRMRFTLRECYGMTECSSFATVNGSGTPGSIGRPFPWLTLELLDGAGRPVEPGQIGEIVLSSEVEGAFLPSYLDNPAATAAALRGGKLHTGDTARALTGGDLAFVGRLTDSLRVRGENVSAWEIERVFATHPAIAASAAVGVAGEVGEQEILLYVQFEPSADVSFEELARWAEEQLAPFQQPRYYVRVTRFETTPSQRIRKHLLARTLELAWDRKAPRPERRAMQGPSSSARNR